MSDLLKSDQSNAQKHSQSLPTLEIIFFYFICTRERGLSLSIKLGTKQNDVKREEEKIIIISNDFFIHNILSILNFFIVS